jgi:hypothetical protein
MALTIIDPGLYNVLVPWGFFNSHTMSKELRESSSVDNIDASNQTDSYSDDPTFDTAHEVIKKSPYSAASSDIGDNTGGASSTLTLNPTLSYTYSKGYSSTHETSEGLTIGITQAFKYTFDDIGGSTTLSATGSFDWSQSGTDDHTQSTTEGVSGTFAIPPGKRLEEVLLLSVKEGQVPYSLDIHIDGAPNNIAFTWENELGSRDLNTDSPSLIAVLQSGPLPNEAPIGSYKDVNWSDFWIDDGRATYSLHGTLTVQDIADFTVKLYDITFAPLTPASQTVRAEYDPAVPIGVHLALDDTGRRFRDTPFDDWVDGGAGNDVIRLSGGEEIAYANGGDDRIIALDVGRSVLDGGDGDDVIRMTSTAAYGAVLGGDGDDRIRVDAPAAMLYGGGGDDRYVLNGATAGGTVITDTEGHNRLRIETDCVPIAFERILHGDHLYILLGGTTYDRTRDVVWLDFFDNEHNRINGLTTAKIASLAVEPPEPLVPQEIGAELIG